ncbi:metal-sensitive transcriptional regulator [Aurantiacibacter sp. D1-12]|uniref:metal-sensitive transcriptional regulator n=1 Tax=Aurantiacibacter sp. D1-12 TaxID=2993658 RepID=UPI00315900AE
MAQRLAARPCGDRKSGGSEQAGASKKLAAVESHFICSPSCNCWNGALHIYPQGVLQDGNDMAANESSEDIVKRLNRIAGQAKGVARMIEEDRYCIDVLTQMQAIKSALAKVESAVLKRHAATCVSQAIASGDEAEQRQKFSELVDLIERARR